VAAGDDGKGNDVNWRRWHVSSSLGPVFGKEQSHELQGVEAKLVVRMMDRNAHRKVLAALRRLAATFCYRWRRRRRCGHSKRREMT
jgi:hypothetical protein